MGKGTPNGVPFFRNTGDGVPYEIGFSGDMRVGKSFLVRR
jgi:hypothetical protein